MRSNVLLTTLVVALFLGLPVSSATWYAYGSYEPDTLLDDETFMPFDRPGTASNIVYFNVYTTWGPLGGATGSIVNPNVGILHTNVDLVGSQWFEAVLGVWTDCNGDGYIGMAETAVREYDARLLLSDDVCPASVGPTGTWAGANNYNGWVTELIPIQNGLPEIGPECPPAPPTLSCHTVSDADRRIHKDAKAMVWGDNGLPDDPAGGRGIECQGRSRGDSYTTGGILYAMDCQGNGIAVARSAQGVSVDTGERVRIIQTWDSIMPSQLDWGSDPRCRPDDQRPSPTAWESSGCTTTSPLNQRTFGSESSEHSAVRLQDCSDPNNGIIVTGPASEGGRSPVGPIDLPGRDMDGITLLRPVPSNPVNTNVQSWTVPGTLNYTLESIWTLPVLATGPTRQENTPNCDFSDDAGQDFYDIIEGNIDIPPYEGKDAAGFNFRFYTASRGTVPASAYPISDCNPRTANLLCLGAGKAGVPTDFGVELLNWPCSASSCFQSNWYGGGIAYTPRTIERDGLIGNPRLPDARHFTFYANIDNAGGKWVLPGGSGTYGSAQCGDNTAGEHNGWNCKRSAWYQRTDGSYPDLGSGMYARGKVGDTYVLRDIDCWDGSLGMAGLGASPAFYGPNPCERPSPLSEARATRPS